MEDSSSCHHVTRDVRFALHSPAADLGVVVSSARLPGLATESEVQAEGSTSAASATLSAGASLEWTGTSLRSTPLQASSCRLCGWSSGWPTTYSLPCSTKPPSPKSTSSTHTPCRWCTWHAISSEHSYISAHQRPRNPSNYLLMEAVGNQYSSLALFLP